MKSTKRRNRQHKGDTKSFQFDPVKTSIEKTTKTPDTDNRSRDIDDNPCDQNPGVVDSDEMSDFNVNFFLSRNVNNFIKMLKEVL